MKERTESEKDKEKEKEREKNKLERVTDMWVSQGIIIL